MVRAVWKNLSLPPKQEAGYGYSAAHSVKTHEGFTLKSGDVAPARPWIEVTIEQYQFLQELKQKIKSKTSLSLDKAITESFVELAEDFGAAMQQNIIDPIWAWPRTTIRESGEIVSSPRNIVDLETLLNSYSMVIK